MELLKKIWPVYRAGIARYFAAQVDDSEASQLRAIFTRFIAANEPVEAASKE